MTGGVSMKKYAVMVLAIMLAGVMAAGAWADYWNEGHSGTESDPYVIGTSTELEALRDRVNAGTEEAGRYYKLTANLNGNFITVGTDRNPFRGHFDGQNHEIEVSVESQGNFSGLFGTVSTEGSYAVRNLKIRFTGRLTSGANTDGRSVGGIVLSLKSGIIDNCSFSGTLSSYCGYEKDNTVGGIVGVMSGGTVRNCSFTGNLSADTVPGGSNRNVMAGGIVGVTKEGAGNIEGCSSTGSIYAGYFGYAGGIIGRTISAATVKNCTFSGTVQGRAQAGGIAGFLSRCSVSDNTVLSTSTNPTLIKGGLYAGGIAGNLSGTSAESAVIESCVVSTTTVVEADLDAGTAGGIVGLMGISTVKNNEAYASVRGKTAGGVIGKLRAATYSASGAGDILVSTSYAVISNNRYSYSEHGIGSNAQGVPGDEGCTKVDMSGNNDTGNTQGDNQTDNQDDNTPAPSGGGGGGCNTFAGLTAILLAAITLRKSHS